MGVTDWEMLLDRIDDMTIKEVIAHSIMELSIHRAESDSEILKALYHIECELNIIKKKVKE